MQEQFLAASEVEMTMQSDRKISSTFVLKHTHKKYVKLKVQPDWHFALKGLSKNALSWKGHLWKFYMKNKDINSFFLY